MAGVELLQRVRPASPQHKCRDTATIQAVHIFAGIRAIVDVTTGIKQRTPAFGRLVPGQGEVHRLRLIAQQNQQGVARDPATESIAFVDGAS